VRYGLGGKAGSGRQFVSWIHEYDFCKAVEFLIERGDMNGVVNLAAPNPLRNQAFMKIIRRAWGAKLGLPANRWMLELGAVLLGTETELILKSRRVIPKRLIESGFNFRFPEWQAAAHDLVERWRRQKNG
jgi:NAD dependent epimerase/dehydratase family enzyme